MVNKLHQANMTSYRCWRAEKVEAHDALTKTKIWNHGYKYTEGKGQVLQKGFSYEIKKGPCQTEWKFADDVEERPVGDTSQLENTIDVLNTQEQVTSEFSSSNPSNLSLKQNRKKRKKTMEEYDCECKGDVEQKLTLNDVQYCHHQTLNSELKEHGLPIYGNRSEREKRLKKHFKNVEHRPIRRQRTNMVQAVNRLFNRPSSSSSSSSSSSFSSSSSSSSAQTDVSTFHSARCCYPCL